MLNTTAICKQRAAQCARRAILTTDETLRALYRDLAEQWQNMANELSPNLGDARDQAAAA